MEFSGTQNNDYIKIKKTESLPDLYHGINILMQLLILKCLATSGVVIEIGPSCDLLFKTSRANVTTVAASVPTEPKKDKHNKQKKKPEHNQPE